MARHARAFPASAINYQWPPANSLASSLLPAALPSAAAASASAAAAAFQALQYWPKLLEHTLLDKRERLPTPTSSPSRRQQNPELVLHNFALSDVTKCKRDSQLVRPTAVTMPAVEWVLFISHQLEAGPSLALRLDETCYQPILGLNVLRQARLCSKSNPSHGPHGEHFSFHIFTVTENLL